MDELYHSVKELIDKKVAEILNKGKNIICEEKVASVVKREVYDILSSYYFSEEEIRELNDKKYSKTTFGLKFPLLSEKRDSSRYYSKSVILSNGKQYYVTNDCYGKNRNQLNE